MQVANSIGNAVYALYDCLNPIFLGTVPPELFDKLIRFLFITSYLRVKERDIIEKK